MTKDEARAVLLGYCPKGSTVFNVLEHVTASGMTRYIKSYVFEPASWMNSSPRAQKATPGMTDIFLSGYIATLLDRKRPANRDGVKVVGCGMDMGFDLVYRLSMELYGDGYALNARWL